MDAGGDGVKPLELPRTKREYAKALRDAWAQGVCDAQDHLERAAERMQNSNFRESQALQDASNRLDGLRIRRRR